MSERRNEDRAQEVERNLIDVSRLSNEQVMEKYRTDLMNQEFFVPIASIIPDIPEKNLFMQQLSSAVFRKEK